MDFIMSYLSVTRSGCQKTILFISIIIFYLNIFVQSTQSTQSMSPIVFSAQYLQTTQSLSPQTDVEEFQFISHDWVVNYLKNIQSKFEIINLFDQDSHQQLMKQLMIKGAPVDDIRALGQWDDKEISYETFLTIKKLYQKRRWIPFDQILPELDYLLVNTVLQERYLKSNSLESIKTLYNKRLKHSFQSMIRNLMLLRSDIEIASLLVGIPETTSPVKQAEELMRPCMGRVFFVERKENKRLIRLIGSGTVVEIHGRKFIVTCRHFNPITPDHDLEIYFIPSAELSLEDYLPRKKLVSADSEVDWDHYQHYSIKRISLLNAPDMESKLFLGNTEPIVISKGAPIHLSLDQIKNLKKIEDNIDNDDLAFMEVKDSQTLQHACRFEPEAVDLNSGNIWLAGYPADGLTSHSFVVVGPSKSQLYKSIIAYHDERLGNSNWHYKITSFPTSHGISGGPIFQIRNRIPVVVGTMTGIDFRSMGVLCSMITPRHIDILK